MAPQDPNAPTDSNGTSLLVTAVATLVISWLSVALRTYVRAGMTMSFQVDDWVMLAGLVSASYGYLEFNLRALTLSLDRPTSQYRAPSSSQESPMA